MIITENNFNEYVNMAADLAIDGHYDEATKILEEAWTAYSRWANEHRESEKLKKEAEKLKKKDKSGYRIDPDEWDDDWYDPDEWKANLHVARAVIVLAFSEWRAAHKKKDYAHLAESLDKKYCPWSDDFIDVNLNFNGAWVMREKALAYRMLAKNWATDPSFYLDGARLYMKRALNIFKEYARITPQAQAFLLCKDIEDIKNAYTLE